MDMDDDDSAYVPDDDTEIAYTDEEPRYALLRVLGSLPEKLRMPRDIDNLGSYPLARLKKSVFEAAAVEFNLTGVKRALQDDTRQNEARLARVSTYALLAADVDFWTAGKARSGRSANHKISSEC